MTTRRCWELSILARWFSGGAGAFACLMLVALQTTPETALRSLGAGVEALDKGDIPTALRNLTLAERALPALADYTAFWIASAHAAAKDNDAVNKALAPLWRVTLPSPVAGRGAALGAKAYLDSKNPKAAFDLLVRHERDLPQPQGRALVAQALEDSGNFAGASSAWQEVYYGYPLAPEAADAARALVRLESKLGGKYPQPSPRIRLERADKLLDAHEAVRARAEYVALGATLDGELRDLARVRAGGADYAARQTEAAVLYLRALDVVAPEADAERLYWLAQGYRRLERMDEALGVLREMENRCPKSPWRVKALIAVANSYLIENDAAHFVPLYRACAGDSWQCHWNVAWRAVLERKSEADGLLKEHLIRFPGSDKGGGCLYWLGRLADERRDSAAARRYYLEVTQRFPNYYYGMLARSRVGRAAGTSVEAEGFLRGLQYPDRPAESGLFEPTPVSRQRVERGRLLEHAGLMVWAYGELRWGARTEGPTYLLALELAEMAARAGEPDKGLHFVKANSPGYLYLPRSAAPARFWKLAFPWPYRGPIDYWSRERGIDPYVVAGLIRQESEFDRKVHSYAGAIGLTQIMPGTGRELSRRAGVVPFSTALLHQAEPNVKIGTYYLKTLLSLFEGSVEAVLAGYNGGPSRSALWRKWGPFREPAEFVETIPLEQSREYVQIVLRNADLYRELYANEPAPEYKPAPAPAAPARKRPSRAKK